MCGTRFDSIVLNKRRLFILYNKKQKMLKFFVTSSGVSVKNERKQDSESKKKKDYVHPVAWFGLT
jgi:hypothetical protein